MKEEGIITKLTKNTDIGKLAPMGRIQDFWLDKGIRIEDNKVQSLVENYEFAGIEFGNWVPQDERLSYVNDVYKGLPIICDFLHIPHHQLGQQTISLAFGARGRRRAAAHFEPWSFAINLTRKAGRKSFLHEYIHALDCILYEATKGEYGLNPQRLFSAYFTTSTVNTTKGKLYLNNSRIFEENLRQFVTEDGVRGAFARLFWNLCFYVETKNGKSDLKWSKFYTICKGAGEYWAYPWEILARSFEAYFAHIYLKEEATDDIKAVAKSTKFFGGKGATTTVYPKPALLEEFKPYFKDVLKCFEWVLDADKMGKPRKNEPKFAPSSSIINEADDLDLAKLRRKSKVQEAKKVETKKPEIKIVKKAKPEVKKTKIEKPKRKVADKPEKAKEQKITSEISPIWRGKIKRLAKISAPFQVKSGNERKIAIMEKRIFDEFISKMKSGEYSKEFVNSTLSHFENKLRQKLEQELEAKKNKKDTETSKKAEVKTKSTKDELIDTLSNSMEFLNEEEFVKFITTNNAYDMSISELKFLYSQYWKLEPKLRNAFSPSFWDQWIKRTLMVERNRLKGKEFIDKLEKEEEAKKQKKSKQEETISASKEYEIENFSYHPKLLSDYISGLRSGGYFSNYKIGNIFEIIDQLNDKWENREFISWEFAVSILEDLPSVKERFEQMERVEVEKFTQELIWFCMFASQNIFDHKIDKRVVSLLKKFKARDLMGLKEKYRIFTVTKRDYEKLGKVKKQKDLDLDDLQYITKRMCADDEYRPAMNGVYYNTEKEQIVMTDSYKLLLLPVKYLENNIITKLQPNGISAIGVKDFKNFQKIDERFPPVENIIADDSELTLIFTAYVEEELEKIQQVNHCAKFSGDIKNYKQYVKFSKDGGYFAINYKYYQNILETFKKLGKNTFEVFKTDKKDRDWKTQAFYLIADDIKALLMPVRMTGGGYGSAGFSESFAFDITLYDFENKSKNYPETIPIFNQQPLSLIQLQQNITRMIAEMILGEDINLRDSVNDDLQLFDNQTNDSMNIEQTIDSGLSDDITASELEVNAKYDLPEVTNNNTEVVSIRDMKRNKIKPMQLPSKYNSLLGKVPNNFRMLLWGAPGHGKSSLALTIGNDIARKCKVLFVSAEESVQSATLQNRIKRFKANSKNLMFNDTTNPAIIESIIAKLNPKFIIIDSVNVIQGKVEAIINLMLKYPDIGFIVIAQATKDHKRYSGLGSLAHAVDIVVNVKSGTAQAEKNRFAPLGSMAVKGITM